MARCGCASGCNCVHEPGPGITQRGNGSPGSPLVTGAYASADAGNCLRFGSDQGLYAPCSDEEGQDICGVSVGNLPAERLVFGRGGAGRQLAPDTMLKSFERAIDLGVDGTHTHVRELGDGTPVCYPRGDLQNRTGIDDTPLGDLGLQYYKNARFKVGWQPTSQDDQAGPYNILGYRHGTFGFVEPDIIGGATLADVLQAVGRRSVLLLQMIPPYSPALPEKVMSLIFRYCAQEAVIVGSTVLDDLAVFTDGGLPTCFFANGDDDAVENPPSALTDAGVEWFAGRLRDVTYEHFAEYAAAGINVLGFMAQRHWEWALLDRAGARGCISDDALYMTADPARYRSRTMSSTLKRQQVQPGMLGYWCDSRQQLGEGPGAPGEVHYPHQARGFYYPDKWINEYGAAAAFYMPGRGPSPSNVQEYSGTPYRTSSGTFDVLTGWLNPVPWPDDYTIDFEISFRDTPGADRHAGMIIGCEDDYAHDDRLALQRAYWLVGIWWNGSIFATRYENGQIQENSSANGPQLAEDAFYHIRVIVTPSDVTTQRIASDGSVEVETTATASSTRGPYTLLYKNEVSGGTWVPYATAWRNLVFSPNEGAQAQQSERVSLRSAGPVVDPLDPVENEDGPGAVEVHPEPDPGGG